MAEHSIFDVAEWFLQKESCSHKKLQKLCYYAVAWSYALFDESLFYMQILNHGCTGLFRRRYMINIVEMVGKI